MTEKFEKCLDFSVILGLLETQVSEPKSWPYLKWVKMMTPQEWPGSPYVAIPTVCGHMLTRCLGWVCPFHWPGCSVVLESPEFPLAESRGFGLGGSGADSEARAEPQCGTWQTAGMVLKCLEADELHHAINIFNR
jgi:hypothetical protein